MLSLTLHAIALVLLLRVAGVALLNPSQLVQQADIDRDFRLPPEPEPTSFPEVEPQIQPPDSPPPDTKLPIEHTPDTLPEKPRAEVANPDAPPPQPPVPPVVKPQPLHRPEPVVPEPEPTPEPTPEPVQSQPRPEPQPVKPAPSVVVPPRPTDDNPAPGYPRQARKRGYEGKVVVHVLVGSEGRVKSVEVKESSGFAILDKAARESVEDWKFLPGMRDGKPEEAFTDVTIRFELTDD
ncbi:MAG: energy transducer TonB [Planctomycetes bacterium]|nr:energy transducer TonB [Planctomycetota bacterium]